MTPKANIGTAEKANRPSCPECLEQSIEHHNVTPWGGNRWKCNVCGLTFTWPKRGVKKQVQEVVIPVMEVGTL